MKQERARWWTCPQTWLIGAVLALLLVGAYGLQRYMIQGAGPVAGPVPVIDKMVSQAPSTKPRPQPVDCAAMPCLALTFDDGPNPLTTPQILSALEAAHVRATFFVVGSRVPGNEAILRRMYADGFEIGNHSWSHPDLTKLPAVQVHEQVIRTQLVVMAAGVPPPTLFRPPYGAVNQTVRSQVPLTLALWDEDPEDWKTADVNQIVTKTLAAARPGRVVDMHDIYAPTVQAMPQLLEKLKSQYRLVTMSELLNLTPGQRGEFFGR